MFFREYLPIPGEIQLCLQVPWCALCGEDGKLATDAVCLAEMRVLSLAGYQPGSTVFDRSQGRELGGRHPEGRYCELGKDQGTKLGDTS